MLIARTLYITSIQKAFEFVPIVVLIGARQVGKTSIMKSLPTEQYKSTLFLNGQDAEIADKFQKMSILEQYLKLNLNDDLDGLLMVDEFQYVDKISTMLKLLSDKYEHLHILCSGSSSLDIFQKVEESLAGRVRIIEVLSLSFAEYLLFNDNKLWKLQQKTPIADKAITEPLQQQYENYLVYGGLPRVALATRPEDKMALLNDIYQTYLLNDVRKHIKNEHFVAFNRLLRLLSTQIGNLVNINELSRESGLSYVICEQYIHLLQKMYIIRMIEPYSNGKRKVISQMKKVYFYDLGLRNIIYNNFNEITFRVDKGAIFENEIMLELWRNQKPGDNLYFYRTVNGTEVDFVMDGPTRKLLVECKFKNFEKPVKINALHNLAADFSDTEVRKYIPNANLMADNDGITMLPGFLADRMQ